MSITLLRFFSHSSHAVFSFVEVRTVRMGQPCPNLYSRDAGSSESGKTCHSSIA